MWTSWNNVMQWQANKTHSLTVWASCGGELGCTIFVLNAGILIHPITGNCDVGCVHFKDANCHHVQWVNNKRVFKLKNNSFCIVVIWLMLLKILIIGALNYYCLRAISYSMQATVCRCHTPLIQQRATKVMDPVKSGDLSKTKWS